MGLPDTNDDYEVEWDNDRSYRPTINFILNG